MIWTRRRLDSTVKAEDLILTGSWLASITTRKSLSCRDGRRSYGAVALDPANIQILKLTIANTTVRRVITAVR